MAFLLNKDYCLKFFVLVITIFFTHSSYGQVIKQPLSVLYTGLGAYSKNFADVFSAASNQAALAQTKTAGFGVYGERKFGLKELSAYTFIAVLPTAYGTFGVQGDYFGSAAYNESQLGVLYARKITNKIDVGAKFNYYAVHIPGNINVFSINFEIGAIIHFSDKFHSGFYVYNPGGSNLGKTGRDKLASIYKAGFGYEVSDLVFIGTEIIKQQNRPISVNAGLQYNLHKNIFIRTGISTLTNSYFSVGLHLDFARININTSYHPQLGFTPGILLLLNHKNTKD